MEKLNYRLLTEENFTMASHEQKIYAFKKSLQLIEKKVQNGSLHVSDKSFLALYSTYEKLVDLSLDSNWLNGNDLESRKSGDSLISVEKRLHPRVELEGYVADINQGSVAYTAFVHDVSLEGFRLDDLPAKFSSIKEGKFTIVISSLFDSVHYKLIAYFKWRKVSDLSADVGFHLVGAPVAWSQFINMIFSENDL